MAHSSDKIGMHGDAIETWDLLADEEGEPIELSAAQDMHIQVLGELSGAEVLIEGSNVKSPDEKSWAMLADTESIPLDFVDTAQLRYSSASPRWLRPRVEGGDVNTKVTVVIVFRRFTR